jgi:hypothetical protein
MTAQLEVARVADHIQRAESLAQTRDLSQLTHLQRIIRQLLLRALADYRAGGRFPKNRDFAEKTPYFIDADGTRCAMAHLMELGGEQELVAKIASERNNAYVRELADEQALLAWLAAAGLTVEEAAAIQPAYCSLVTDCICGGDFSHIEYPVPAKGVLEGIVQANGKLRVDKTYGDSLGITVGMEVDLADNFGSRPTAGAHVVAPIEIRTASVDAITLDVDAMYKCSSQGVGQAPPLSAEDFAAAVLANDCAATLRAQSSQWERDSCEEMNPDPLPISRDGGGCNAGGSDAAGVGILLALVTAIVHRRAR